MTNGGWAPICNEGFEVRSSPRVLGIQNTRIEKSQDYVQPTKHT